MQRIFGIPPRTFIRLFLLLSVVSRWRADAADSTGRPATVETISGRVVTGESAFTNNAVVLDGTNQIALAEIRRLNFEVSTGTNATGHGKGNGLLGYYFSRTNFQGGVVVRLDERVDFDWATAEPAQGVPADGFSVIWSGDIEAPADGSYVFSVVADDTAQLTVASNMVIEAGVDRRGQEVVGQPVVMQAGTRYPLLLKYHEFGGAASIRLFWSGPGLSRRIVPKDRLYAKSRLPQHTSDLLSDEGLLATYYKNSDFSGETLTRVDPQIDFNWVDRDPAAGFNRAGYSVRWQGQLKPDFSEVFTFHVIADEPMRVWVEGRPLIMPGGQFYMTEVRESLPLLAGERYDLRIEAQSTSGNAAMKLMWSSPSIQKTVVPSTNLFPSAPVAGSGATMEKSGRYPRGVLLRNGTYVAIPVERATESVVRAGRWLRASPISTVNVSRIFCQPVSRGMADRIPRGRPGLLLAKGDFVDGDFKSLENGQVRIGSVLFGVKSYDLNKDVLAVVLRDPQPVEAEFTVRLQDQSALRLREIAWDGRGVSWTDPSLGRGRVDWSDVLEVNRGPRAATTASTASAARQ